MPPSPILYLSPTTDTALAHLLAKVRQVQIAQPLQPVTLLLPSSGVIQGVRRRLGRSMGVRLYQFYSLGQAALDAAGIATHWVGDTLVYRLVRHLLEQMQAAGELSSFAAVWEKPGFTQVLVAWLREMKSQGIFPEDFAAHPLPTNLLRDQQLALIYQRYQTFLQQGGFSDSDGLMWQAAEALEGDDRLWQAQGRLAVFGFDQFTPVQRRILRAVAGRFDPCEIYLTWDARRPADSQALARLRHTRQRLEAELRLEVKELDETGANEPALARLRRGLFEAEVDTAHPVEAGPVRLVAAPLREAEVRWALREVKRLLLEGAPVEEVALLTPQPAVYARLVETVAEEYGLPLHLPQRLENQPVMAALSNLLRLPPAFAWRGVLDALRSPFLRQPWLSVEQVDLLDQLSRERPVVGGREQWQFVLRPLEAATREAEDEDLGPAPLVSQLAPDMLAQIEAGLLAFFEHLTPPAQATPREYVIWLQEKVLGLPEPVSDEAEAAQAPALSLEMAACCRKGDNSQVALLALGALLGALRSLVEAAELAPSGEAGRMEWQSFLDELSSLLSRVELPPDPRLPGVRFGALESGRALAVDHLFVLGLAEGEFPQPPPPDALYAPREREDHPLPVLRYLPGGDASLFWQVVGNARRSLTLLRPYLDENGAPWLASPYWGEVQQALGWGEQAEIKIKIAETPGFEEAASPAELLTALAAAGAVQAPQALEKLWQYAQAAAAVQRQRQSWQPAPRFEGVFEDAGLIQELEQRYGERYVWSTSRLNRYGACPYGFFAQTVLKLEERSDPEEGLDAMQRGSLLHAVLEVLYGELTTSGLPPSPENQPATMARLEHACDVLFASAPLRYGFRPGALWNHEQAELRRQLRALLRWECEQNREGVRFRPFRQELRFGLPGASLPALEFAGPEGTTLRLHGVIDRLDQDAGGALRVVDYKSGSTRYSLPDVKSGLAFQAPLYALAAERLLGQPAAESYYLHIPLRDSSGKLKFSEGAQQDAIVETVVAVAEDFVLRIRRGDFPSLPAKPGFGRDTCSATCEFASLCRADRHSRLKALRQPWAGGEAA